MSDSPRNREGGGFEQFPFIIGWELTLSCTLSCAHCGSSAGEARSRELTLQESFDISDQFPDLMVQEVNFTGGEPLLNEHWAEIAGHLRRLGIAVKLVTNGVALSRNVVGRMSDLELAGIGISVDGLAKTHDHLRGRKGLFEHILAMIRMIKGIDLPLTIITTVNAINVVELPILLDILVSEGIRYWQVQPLFPQGRGRDDGGLKLSAKEFLWLGEFFSQWKSIAHDRGLEIMPSDSFGYYTERDKREPAWGKWDRAIGS